MKLLKPAYFAVGMTGMFSMAMLGHSDWLDSLPSWQGCALALITAVALACLLTWLTQFGRRYLGPERLLQAFALGGLLVSAALVVEALQWLPAATDIVANLLRLALFALFCLVALHTQPASEHVENLS